MFGHIEGYAHWARHLLHLRHLQQQTGGITEFVPLPFVHMEAPMYLRGHARQGPSLRETLLMHAVARLALHPLIPNIQASWVKLGPEWAQRRSEEHTSELQSLMRISYAVFCLKKKKITKYKRKYNEK